MLDTTTYQRYLDALTINSRAVITELTLLAEEHVTDAAEIVAMVEERIKKALPRHKLFALYLVDSICKNVGAPYPMLFAKNLFKVFTLTYSMVPDTTTRQNMINLFKTWMTAKAQTGAPLFPMDTLQKIEKFIIQATLIQGQGQGILNIPSLVAQGLARMTPDMLNREGRGQLYRSIQIMKMIDRVGATPEDYGEEDMAKLHQFELDRNRLVGEANDVVDLVMETFRPNQPPQYFEKNQKQWMDKLSDIRQQLDRQTEALTPILESAAKKLAARRQRQDARQRRHKLRELRRQFVKDNLPTIASPDASWFSHVFGDNSRLFEALKEVGQPVVTTVDTPEVINRPLSPSPAPVPELSLEIAKELALPEVQPQADVPLVEGDMQGGLQGGLLGFSMSLFDSDDDENDDNSPQYSPTSLTTDLPGVVADDNFNSADEKVSPEYEPSLLSPSPLPSSPSPPSLDSESDIEIGFNNIKSPPPPPPTSLYTDLAFDDDEEEYQPEGMEVTPPPSPSPPHPTTTLRLSLKRSRGDSEPRPLKRVRFAI